MRKTLLELVQDILNDMDSDNVNSINDTIESEQVASIVKSCYFEMIGNRNWPHLKKLFQLEHSGSLDRPNYLAIPVMLKEMEFFKYEVQKAGEKVQLRKMRFVHPDEFLEMISQRDSTATNVKTVTDYSGSKLLIYDDRAPSFWTTFDDLYIVTDSYDKTVDDTLQKNKTQCLGYIHPEWVHEDSFIPSLPAEAFPALFAEAKSTAFVDLKQMANQKAEQKASRQQRWLSRKAWRAQGGVRYEDYGRKGRR
jgi:hypothetical protein